MRLQPLFHFLGHLFSNVEVEFFHLLYTHILLIETILPFSSFLLVQLDCPMFDILYFYVCIRVGYPFLLFSIVKYFIHLLSLSLYINTPRGTIFADPTNKTSFLNMQFPSQTSSHQLKEDNTTQSSPPDEQHPRQQEILMQVKIILCYYSSQNICFCLWLSIS